MEVTTLKNVGVPGMRGASPFLRVQSDDRLVSIARRGNPAAYEVLVSRYHSRLLAFTRHMLGSKEDAEDVLQETFAAAYGAMLADERPLNLKPWLYRIARNRALNHMRRQTAIGVDSLDHHIADHGQSTADRVHKREDLRHLIADVGELAETQRTALLLREIDALSYDQIAEAMDTTVPGVKSLLVRARVSLAEATEARRLSCDQVREELGEVAEGLKRLSPAVRRHVRQCERCSLFRKSLRETNRALALMLPIGPLLIIKKLLLAQLGTTASAGGGAAAGAAAATVAPTAGGALSAGVTAIASKTAATVAAAAIVTAGAVEVDNARHAKPQRAPATIVAAAAPKATPAPATPAPAGPAVEKKTVKSAAPVRARRAVETAASEPKPVVTPTVPAPAPVPPPVAAAPVPVPVQIAPEEHVDVVTLPPQGTTPAKPAPAPPTAALPAPPRTPPTLRESPAPPAASPPPPVAAKPPAVDPSPAPPVAAPAPAPAPPPVLEELPPAVPAP